MMLTLQTKNQIIGQFMQISMENKIKVECFCIKCPVNPPKKVYVIRRMDGSFGKQEMFFTIEMAKKHMNEGRKFYKEDITPHQNRTWDGEHYLAECEIVEIKILS